MPATQIIHFGGASGRGESMRIQFRKNEAMSIFVRKHMRDRYRFFPVWILRAGILAYGLYSFLGPLARNLALPVLDGCSSSSRCVWPCWCATTPTSCP